MSEPLRNVFDWLKPQTKPAPGVVGGTFSLPTSSSPDNVPNVFDWLAKDLGKKPPALAATGTVNVAKADDELELWPGEKPKAAEPLEPGNINLFERPRVKNPDGTVSTVLSRSFGTDKGEVLLPKISDDGRVLSDQEALDLYRQTGKHLGIFANPDEANAYAVRLHDDFAAGKYDKKADFSKATGGSSKRASFANGSAGASSTAPMAAPPPEQAPLAREDEAAMMAALGQTNVVGAAGEGAAAALPESEAWAAKINRLGGVPLRAAAELVGPGTEIGGRLRHYAEGVEEWAKEGQETAEAEAAKHALSTEAGLPAKIVHGAVAGAGPMALGMGAAAVAGPAGAAATFGTGGMAATYTDAIDRGVPRGEALLAALPRGIAEGILAKGLPAAQTENLLAKALTKEAAKAAAAEAAAKVTLADAGAQALHGAATMTGFEGLGQMGEIATGRRISLEEQIQRDTSAALTGAAMSGALPTRQALENKLDLARLRTGVRTAAEQRAARVPRAMTEEEIYAHSQSTANREGTKAADNRQKKKPQY